MAAVVEGRNVSKVISTDDSPSWSTLKILTFVLPNSVN